MKRYMRIFLILNLSFGIAFTATEDQKRVENKIKQAKAKAQDAALAKLKKKIERLDLSRVPKKYHKIFDSLKNMDDSKLSDPKEFQKRKKKYHQFLERVTKNYNKAKNDKKYAGAVRDAQLKLKSLKIARVTPGTEKDINAIKKSNLANQKGKNNIDVNSFFNKKKSSSNKVKSNTALLSNNSNTTRPTLEKYNNKFALNNDYGSSSSDSISKEKNQRDNNRNESSASLDTNKSLGTQAEIFSDKEKIRRFKRATKYMKKASIPIFQKHSVLYHTKIYRAVFGDIND